MTKAKDLSQADLKSLFPVGQIVGFHGLSGEVKVKPATNNIELLADIEHVVLTGANGKSRLQLDIETCRIDRRTLLLSFVGYPDRNSVENFTGSSLFAPHEEIGELIEEEFWVKDLVGLEVFTTEGNPVGKVISIIDGATDILEIHREGDPADKTILVPFVKALVPVVDTKKARIEVVDLPGLLESQ